jgi:hypothetical protein
MARSRAGFAGVSGLLGPVVIKQYRDKTVVTTRPVFKKKQKRSKNQKENSSLFKYAVAYAQSIIRDPKKKAEYAKKLKKNASVYHAAISEFVATNAFPKS